MLELHDIHTYYGVIQALRGVSVKINAGKIVTLIGANGAGKSTLLMTITGITPARQGSVIFKNNDITKAKTDDIINQGITISPEGRRIFPHLTVFENLQLGALNANPEHFDKNVNEVFTLFPRLKERQKQRGGTLSGGEQQMLAIARALMSEPTMLLLDEPSLGLAPLIVSQIFTAIKQINQEKGITILLVEQNANQALHLADYGYVLVTGHIRLQGSGDELLANPDVQAAYLEGGH